MLLLWLWLSLSLGRMPAAWQAAFPEWMLVAMPPALRGVHYRPPKLTDWLLPYREWESEYREYFQRHYHDPKLTFRPTWIVMHYTVTPNAQVVWDSFAQGSRMDAGDYGLIFGHPSVQLMIDHDGTVYRLLPLDRRCTGAYGMNHKAISIEMVAMSEQELLARTAQVRASFYLVRYLMDRYHIPLDHVIGHFDVSVGRLRVKDYLDYADSLWPHGYPPQYFRFDPGFTYMGWLRTYLRNCGYR